MLGKAFDTFGPLGPALVTREAVPDPHSLELALTLNGVERQRANTRHFIFSIPYLIRYISAVMTLEPGDVIATGTPAKLPAAPGTPPFMRPGDVVAAGASLPFKGEVRRGMGLSALTKPIPTPALPLKGRVSETRTHVRLGPQREYFFRHVVFSFRGEI